MSKKTPLNVPIFHSGLDDIDSRRKNLYSHELIIDLDKDGIYKLDIKYLFYKANDCTPFDEVQTVGYKPYILKHHQWEPMDKDLFNFLVMDDYGVDHELTERLEELSEKHNKGA